MFRRDMPYIEPSDRREELRGLAADVVTVLRDTNDELSSGEINFFISTILDIINASNYEAMNDLVGVLENVKQEYYRRVISPYEDRKRRLNGEVYLHSRFREARS